MSAGIFVAILFLFHELLKFARITKRNQERMIDLLERLVEAKEAKPTAKDEGPETNLNLDELCRNFRIALDEAQARKRR